MVAAMEISYKWKPLEDLPPDATTLTDNELESLHEVWMDQRESLEKADVLGKFSNELHRQWAIETGIVEGVYSLDRGITQALIERGIEAALIPHEPTEKSPERVARIIQDHLDTLDGIFDFIKGRRELTTGYIKEVHASLLRHQDTFTVVDQFGHQFEKPLEKGAYKVLPNSPTQADGSVHEYCPPDHVASEMDRMIDLHKKHVNRGVPIEVQAAWLHHVFTQIHPFEDGNGRVARAIASLVFVKADWFPLVITRDEWVKYIDALETADHGNLRPLVVLFAQSQKRALRQATEAVYEAKPPETVEEVLVAARDRLVSAGRALPDRWSKARSTAQTLQDVAYGRLGEVAGWLQVEVGGDESKFHFAARNISGPDEQVLEAAKGLDYVPNVTVYNQWAQLDLPKPARIVVSFHGMAPYRGLIGVLVFYAEPTGIVRAGTDDVFQINYREDRAQAVRRFQPWLEAALVKALDLWRQSL